MFYKAKPTRIRARHATAPAANALRGFSLGLQIGFRIIIAVSVSLSVASPEYFARSQNPGEYEVKAAFIYNFAKFAEWPPHGFASSGGAFVIGVVGEDPFGGALDQAVSGKSIQGRPLVIRRLQAGGDLKSCNVVFISESERGRLGQILAVLSGWPVMTVSDIQGFINVGGMIGLTLENNKVRFEINVAAAEQSGLKISSKLLSLASTVRKGPLGN